MTTETLSQAAERHRKMDMLVQGHFEMEHGKACSVGCFNHELGNDPGDFEGYAEHYKIPVWAAKFQEAVFEGLPQDQAKDWHVQFAKKAEQIEDWDAHYHKLMVAILLVALPYDTSNPSVVQKVIALHKRGPSVSQNEWDAAWAAARDAAGAAAWAAAWAAAGAAAGDAVWAAAGAAAWAAMRDGFISDGDTL